MKKILFTFVFICLIIYSCFYPKLIVEASKSGIMIWFEQILPALLPFSIVSFLLFKSNFLNYKNKNSNLIAIIITMSCGFIFGFPIGAKLSADFYKNKTLNKKQATILSITCNNFSPMFVCGYVLPTLFSEKSYLSITYILLYLLPLFLATILIILTYQTESNELIYRKNKENQLENFNLSMQMIDEGILNGFMSLIKLCGYIVLFSIFTKIGLHLCSNSSYIGTIFFENLEISNGILLLKNTKLNSKTTFVCAIQILSLGGLSGIVQTASFLSPAGLSAYKYTIGKVILSLLLTLLSIMYVSNFILQT